MQESLGRVKQFSARGIVFVVDTTHDQTPSTAWNVRLALLPVDNPLSRRIPQQVIPGEPRITNGVPQTLTQSGKLLVPKVTHFFLIEFFNDKNSKLRRRAK